MTHILTQKEQFVKEGGGGINIGPCEKRRGFYPGRSDLEFGM